MEQACGNCRFYKELERSQNGLTEYIGVCVCDVFNAKTGRKLADADISYMEPDWLPCQDYKEKR